MKLIFTRRTKAKAFILSVALLLSTQTSANAGQQFQSLTSGQAQRFSHDLIRSNSQDFFWQGQSRLEREIKILGRRQSASSKPILKIDPVLQEGKQSSSYSPAVLP